MTSQNDYGCQFIEFIDDGSYGSPFKKNTKDPWRLRDDVDSIIEVNIKFIERFLDRRYMQEIYIRDRQYIIDLSHDIAEHGLREPLELFVDPSNDLRFQDGHHRYAACVDFLGYKNLPMIIVESSGKIRARGLNMRSFIPDMLKLVSLALDIEDN